MNEQTRIVALEAELAELRTQLARRDAALAELAERLQPLEQARELAAAAERDARQDVEVELERLRATKLYRLALGPRERIVAIRRQLRR
jgi:hypothetical protein